MGKASRIKKLRKITVQEKIKDLQPKRWIKDNQWQLIGLVLLVIAAYGNSLDNAFVSDDIYAIVNDPELNSWSFIGKNWLNFIQPFVYVLITKVFGKVPFYFHLVNLSGHILAVTAAYLLIELLINKRVAFLASLLLAVHPLSTEAVTWISGGPYSWHAGFLLLSLWGLVKATQGEKKFYVFSCLSFLISLQTFNRSLVMVGIAVILLWVLGQLRKNWKLLIAPTVMALIYVRKIFSRTPDQFNGLVNNYNNHASFTNPLIQIPIAITEYFKLILWPINLTLYHSELFYTKVGYLVSLGVFLLFMAALGYTAVKKRMVFFWLMFFVIVLSPTLTPFGFGWIVAERYAYLASLGIYAVVGMGISRLMTKKGWEKTVIAIVAIAIILLFIRTLVRNRDWQDQDHLWLAAERTSPSSQQNHNNLGDLYSRRGDLKQAEWHFKKAIEINPSYADAMHNLANTYVMMGKFEEAIKLYEDALKNKPSLWQSQRQLEAVKEHLKSVTKDG